MKTDTAGRKTGRKAADRHARSGGQGQGMNWIRQEKRQAIYHRDGFRCLYCARGAESGVRMTLDHLVPHVLGGGNGAENLASACFDCNSLRRDLSLEDFLTVLADRGVRVEGIRERISASVSQPLDMNAGRALVAARRN